METTQPTEIRRDSLGRRLCKAYARSTGESCTKPAVTGMEVCNVHGGSSPQAQRSARLRLLELVDPAVGTLAHELDNPSAEIRLKAANSILDRTGHGRATRIEASDAKTILYERIMAIRAENMAAEPEIGVIEGVVIDPPEGPT